MRTRTIQALLLSVASAALISSCGNSGSFKTDSSTGVVYRFLKHDDNGVKGTDSGYARAVLAYSEKTKDGKDSDLFNSRKRGGDSTGSIMLPLKKTYNGCLEQGLLMMSVGDSAEFQINADSLYIKYFHAPADKLPPGVTGTTIYTFRIKLTSFLSKAEVMAQQNKQREEYMQKMMARKAMESSSIADYLKTNNYENVKPTEDSIFFLERSKAKGKAIKDGDSVEVAYTGMLLNGTIFDQSKKGPDNHNLKIVYSPKATLIQGWIKVLATMHQGEKVKVLIPSALAYGPRGAGQIIAPFSPLVFDMEVVNVKSN